MTAETHQPPYPNKTHELKSWPEYFSATLHGRKKFELRRHDRDFHVGDELLLKEWDPEKPKGILIPGDYPKGVYTGREVLVRVDYIMKAEETLVFHPKKSEFPLHRGYVIMGISLI